jgi:hypothetical protein
MAVSPQTLLNARAIYALLNSTKPFILNIATAGCTEAMGQLQRSTSRHFRQMAPRIKLQPLTEPKDKKRRLLA